MGQDGRKGENENILDRVFYSGISTSINRLDAVHAILQTGEVMLEGKVFGLIGQFLDDAEDGGCSGGHFLLVEHIFLLVVLGDLANGMPDFVGYLIIKGLRESRLKESMPEWKEFIKIVWSGDWPLGSYCVGRGWGLGWFLPANGMVADLINFPFILGWLAPDA
jgi:hypothetical protein